MSKAILVAAVAAGLSVAPLPSAAQNTTAQQNTVAQSTQPAASGETKPKSAKPLSPAQVALRQRQKQCGEEWQAAKAAGKIAKEMKWPQYWSACNKRLRSGG